MNTPNYLHIMGETGQLYLPSILPFSKHLSLTPKVEEVKYAQQNLFDVEELIQPNLSKQFLA